MISDGINDFSLMAKYQMELRDEVTAKTSNKCVFSSTIKLERVAAAIKETASTVVFKNLDISSTELQAIEKSFPALRSIVFEDCKFNGRGFFTNLAVRKNLVNKEITILQTG
jgi:hypothetical protein